MILLWFSPVITISSYLNTLRRTDVERNLIAIFYRSFATSKGVEVIRAMYYQFAGQTIDQTYDAEKRLKDDLSDVPFA